jgi:hypothetical protein
MITMMMMMMIVVMIMILLITMDNTRIQILLTRTNLLEIIKPVARRAAFHWSSDTYV